MPNTVEDHLLEAIGRHGSPVLCGVPAATVLDRVAEAAERFRSAEVRDEAVGLALDNDDAWVVAFLALLAAGARPLVMSSDTPSAEQDRLLAIAGGRRRLVADAHGEPPVLAGEPGVPRAGVPSVLIPTSGSTGEPKLLARSHASLIGEGIRYRDGVDLSSRDIAVLPVPLAHAYGLGWLYGGLLAGVDLRPVPPTALSQISSELAAGATVLVLVPALARLLATRQQVRARRASVAASAPALRIAMVGAGPVDAELESTFRAAFGVGLDRNYGSTELGAVFAGPAGAPAQGIGAPLPGVEYRLVEPGPKAVAAVGPGLLQVRTRYSDGWYDTGDVAELVPGGVRVVGRSKNAVRRGGRWVSPLEIEAVLRTHPQLVDVRVSARAGRHEGEEGIVADVVMASDAVTVAQLREYAGERLVPYKVPDVVNFRVTLARSAAGKMRAPTVYRLTAAAVDAAWAYKKTELLFALHQLGVLDRLAEGTDAGALAIEYGLDAEALDLLLDRGAALGLLSAGPGDSAESAPAELTALIRLEEVLSRSLVSREALADVARSGITARPFEAAALSDPPAELVERYQAVMDSRSARARCALGLRLLRPAPGARLVEVTAGPGRYLDRLLESDPAATGHLWQLGRLSGAPTPRVQAAIKDGRVSTGAQPPAEADLYVVTNAVHDRQVIARLPELVRAPLLVDDVFLPAAGSVGEAAVGAELGLDWLTHGGVACPTIEALRGVLLEAGAQIIRHRPMPHSPCHLVLAKECD